MGLGVDERGLTSTYRFEALLQAAVTSAPDALNRHGSVALTYSDSGARNIRRSRRRLVSHIERQHGV